MQTAVSWVLLTISPAVLALRLFILSWCFHFLRKTKDFIELLLCFILNTDDLTGSMDGEGALSFREVIQDEKRSSDLRILSVGTVNYILLHFFFKLRFDFNTI